MRRPPLLLLLSAAAVCFGSARAEARGWEEIHQTSDDVRITVAPDGIATVQHHLRFRVVAGRFKAFEFAGVDPRAELIAEATVLPEKGTEIAAHVDANPKTPGAIRIAFDEPSGVAPVKQASRVPEGRAGVGRGTYLVDVTYRLDLVATKMLVRDGAMWRLSWTAPASPEGHDGARVVFELPPAPTEPRLASPEQAATTLATLRREPGKDELELVRAHVPRGEAVTWSARVDPKAFPRVVSPELRPAAAPSVTAPAPNNAPLVLLASGLALLAGALAFALRKKQDVVARACEARFVRARPLVAVGLGLGPFAYGASASGALAALLWGTPICGAALVVLAMALGAHRSPVPIGRSRGPGRWKPIADEDVLVARAPLPAAGDALDLGTRAGKATALAIALALGVVAFLLRASVPGAAIAIPLTGVALVPLFVTGTRAQLPPPPAELASRVLAPARDLLGRFVDLAHVELQCVARFGEGTRTFDEVRLLCAPSDRIPGLRTIELATASSESRAAALPEVLVRFDDASQAASKIAQLAPGMSIVPGRAPEEKVLRLVPREPTPSGAARLLARLTRELEGRRATDRVAVAGDEASRPRTAASLRTFAGVDRRVARAPRGQAALASAV